MDEVAVSDYSLTVFSSIYQREQCSLFQLLFFRNLSGNWHTHKVTIVNTAACFIKCPCCLLSTFRCDFYFWGQVNSFYVDCRHSGHRILFYMSSRWGWLLHFSELSQGCLPFPTGMSMVCSPPDPVPTPSCLSWLAGMVKTVCWELEPPEWIFSIPADKTQ